METLTFFDWTFIITACLFNLLIAGIFIAQKFNNEKLTKTIGSYWLLLFIPLLAVFISYALKGKPAWVLICLGVVGFYMLVELLLDYVIHFDFRERWITHVPYILLEYAALFSLIAIAIDVNETLGWVVSACFWISMASLIYLYAGKKRRNNNPQQESTRLTIFHLDLQWQQLSRLQYKLPQDATCSPDDLRFHHMSGFLSRNRNGCSIGMTTSS